MRWLLSCATGTTVAAARDLLSGAAGGIFRRHRERAWDRMAAGRFAGATTVSGDWTGRANPGSLDDLADSPLDRYRQASRGVRVGTGVVGRTRIAEGTADGHRRDQLGSECGDAVDCAAR